MHGKDGDPGRVGYLKGLRGGGARAGEELRVEPLVGEQHPLPVGPVGIAKLPCSVDVNGGMSANRCPSFP